MLIFGGVMVAASIFVGYQYLLQVQCRKYIKHNDLANLKQLVNQRERLATAMLDDAYAEGNKAAFELLLNAGAKPDGIRYERLTLVHNSARNADGFWLKKLLEHGANPNYNDVLRSICPIMEAIEANQPENVRLLIEAGAGVNACASHNESMLAFAWGMRNGEIAMILLEAGALVNPPSHRHESFINKIQRMSEDRYALDEQGERDEDFLEIARQRFRDQGLDVWNATWDESQGDFGVWTIPVWSEKAK